MREVTSKPASLFKHLLEVPKQVPSPFSQPKGSKGIYIHLKKSHDQTPKETQYEKKNFGVMEQSTPAPPSKKGGELKLSDTVKHADNLIQT